MLTAGATKGAKLTVAIAAAGLMLTPAFAASQSKHRPPALALSFDPISSFTPANADPRLAAALAGHGASLADLKFTPAAAKGRPSQVRVAIRARIPTPARVGMTDASAVTAASPVSVLTPATYNLGVAVGWRRFAVSGDVAKVKDGNPALGGRESAIVGVSYSLNRFTGRVAVGADRADEHPVSALRRPDNYSLDVGGSYSVTKRIALTGGVRYQVDRDRLLPLKDDRRDSQAVYIGTAFKF